MHIHNIDDLHNQVADLHSQMERLHEAIEDGNTRLEEGNEKRESIAELAEELNKKLESLSEFTENIAGGLRIAAAETRRAEWFLAIQGLAVVYIGAAGCIWATDMIFEVKLYGVGTRAIEAAMGLLFAALSR